MPYIEVRPESLSGRVAACLECAGRSGATSAGAAAGRAAAACGAGQALARSVLSAHGLEPRPVSVAFEPVRGAYEVGKVAPEILAYHQPDSALARQYAALANQLLASDSGKVLLFAGLRSSVGTSTVLLNLAIAASQETQRSVTLIDAQRHRPSLATKLGLRPLAFLQDVLTGTLGLEQAPLKSPIPRLALLAATASHPEIVLGVEALTWLLSTLKQRSDLVSSTDPASTNPPTWRRWPLWPIRSSSSRPKASPRANRAAWSAHHSLGGRLRGLLHTQLAG